MSTAVPRTTRIVHKPRKRDASDYRVYGYLLDEEWLLKLALENDLGTDIDRWQRGCAIAAAANMLMAEYNDSDTRVAGVLVKGKVRVCGAVASELDDDRMPMPRKASIEKFKEILGATEDPRWYLHV